MPCSGFEHHVQHSVAISQVMVKRQDSAILQFTGIQRIRDTAKPLASSRLHHMNARAGIDVVGTDVFRPSNGMTGP